MEDSKQSLSHAQRDSCSILGNQFLDCRFGVASVHLQFLPLKSAILRGW